MTDLSRILENSRILVVDDMLSIRSMVKAYLTELGAQNMIIKHTGEAAWSVLNQEHIDIVICDWDMPGMTGLQLLEKIRATEAFQHIPFLMLTGTIEKAKVMQAVQAGVSDYLAKPFQPQTLQYKIIKLVSQINN